jgi:tol-pal system protein YbgF
MKANKPLVALLCAGIALSLAGPVAAQSVEQRVSVLERQVRALSDVMLRLDTLTREMQQLRGEVELQNHAMDALKERQRDLYLDLDNRMSKLQEDAANAMAAPAASTRYTPPATANLPAGAAPAPASSISTSGGPGKPIPKDLPPGDPAEESDRYREAFDMLRGGNYQEARRALRIFLIQYPDSDRADNAQYWLGEAGYVTRDFATALQDFTSLIENYPNSPKVADAKLKSGYILYETQRYDDAREMLKAVTRQHSDSTAAQLAQKQLDRMERESR